MKDFKKSFKKSGSFGSRPSGGFGAGRSTQPVERHQATCARCQKSCEVPFKPNGKKPVFCRDCFASQDTDSSERRPSFRAGGERSFTRPNAGADVSAQIEALSMKIDTLTRMVKSLSGDSAPKKRERTSFK